MKTIRMERDFSYRATSRAFVQYLGGQTYQRVPEAAVRAIVSARAGEVVDPIEPMEINATDGNGFISRLIGQ
jgi:hypothetical protein